MSEDRFDQINKLIDALVAQCELVDVEQAGLAECVDLIGKLKALGLSADGLTTAAMGRVGAIQAAEREAATKDRDGGDAGNGAGNDSGFKPEPFRVRIGRFTMLLFVRVSSLGRMPIRRFESRSLLPSCFQDSWVRCGAGRFLRTMWPFSRQ